MKNIGSKTSLIKEFQQGFVALYVTKFLPHLPIMLSRPNIMRHVIVYGLNQTAVEYRHAENKKI